MFLRFVKQIIGEIGSYSETVLVAIQDLLTVEIPVQNTVGNISPNSAVVRNENTSIFDSQLYLFEAVGVLISGKNVEESKQVEYLTVI